MTAREQLEQGLLCLDYQNPQAVDKLLQFSDRLLETNKVMNLTAVVTPEEVIKRHFLDSAAALSNLNMEEKALIDVGCGAGFPGVPAALLYSNTKVTLLDSLGKRIHFLQTCIEEMQMDNVTAIQARAEEFVGANREAFDIATSRAVARMNVLCELSLPLVRVGGVFAAMKSTACDAELQEAQPAIHILGGAVEAVKDYTIPLTEIQQRVVIIRKIKETPKKYPRRFGKISAAPL